MICLDLGRIARRATSHVRYRDTNTPSQWSLLIFEEFCGHKLGTRWAQNGHKAKRPHKVGVLLCGLL